MAAPGKTLELPFIFTDSLGKSEPAKRRLIRKHVMLGKNRGKPRNLKGKSSASLCVFGELDGEQGDPSSLAIKLHYNAIPRKVGSELSFTQLAAPVEPSLLHDVLRFTFMAKKVMYPLESCIVFNRSTKTDTAWIDFLATDAAYMHAAVFTSQAYISRISTRTTPAMAMQAMIHHSAALRLLRERFSPLDTTISDPTVLAILYLTLHAHFMNDFATADHHMKGLRRIVDLRGGIHAFIYSSKLVIELLKCDLGISLHNGTAPVFFRDPQFEPLMPYDSTILVTKDPETSTAQDSWQGVQLSTNVDLSQAWMFLRTFCTSINAAFKRKRPLPKESLLNAMASLMYRLLDMNSFEPNSVDEALRLGLLVFTSHIFLNWQNLRVPHTHLPNTYRECLLHLKLPDMFPPQVILWLLMIGSISVFTAAEDTWLIPWVRVNINLCQGHGWEELRMQLEAFPWIDMLHNQPGQAIFDAAILSEKTEGKIN